MRVERKVIKAVRGLASKLFKVRAKPGAARGPRLEPVTELHPCIDGTRLVIRCGERTRAIPHSDHVRFEMWIRNGTANKISDVVVQQCVMLAGATGFDARSNDNKVIRDPFVACRNESGDAWVITAWQACGRSWANPPCPCIHSDPRFPDCLPGETQTLVGWVSFYRGTNIDRELNRIAGLGWQDTDPAAGETEPMPTLSD